MIDAHRVDLQRAMLELRAYDLWTAHLWTIVENTPERREAYDRALEQLFALIETQIDERNAA